MKKLTMVLAIGLMSLLLVGSAFAQSATAVQNLSFAVNSVYKIEVSGDPGNMVISTGTAGSNALTSVTDNSTSYGITQNNGNTVKITAALSSTLGAGYFLTINLASTLGGSLNAVNIEDAAAHNVVTAIGNGADANQQIEYVFSANASAGVLATTNRTVTLTISN